MALEIDPLHQISTMMIQHPEVAIVSLVQVQQNQYLIWPTICLRYVLRQFNYTLQWFGYFVQFIHHIPLEIGHSVPQS